MSAKQDDEPLRTPEEIEVSNSGCVALICICFGIPVGIIMYFVNQRAIRIEKEYLSASCVILSKKIDQRFDPKDGFYKVPVCTFQFTARVGKQLEAVERKFVVARDVSFYDSFEVGNNYTCWYDPQDPEQAQLSKPQGGSWSSVLWVPTLFIGFGVLFLIVWFLGRRRLRLACAAKSQTESPRD